MARRVARGNWCAALYDAVLSLTERIGYQHSMTGTSAVPQRNMHPVLCPDGLVVTGDGHVAVAAPSDHRWQLLSRIIERPELAHDPRSATNAARLPCATEVHAAIEVWSRGPTTRAPTLGEHTDAILGECRATVWQAP